MYREGVQIGDSVDEGVATLGYLGVHSHVPVPDSKGFPYERVGRLAHHRG
jgi:hypothetical protein